MAGVTMLAYGVVFVLLIGEIDLSISYVSGVAGVVVAQLTLAGSSHELPGPARDRARDRCLRADRRVPGLDRGADRRACLRRHPRRLPDLAGRDPEVDPAGRPRDPGQHGQQRRQLLLLQGGRLDHRLRRRRDLRRQHCRRGDLHADGTASPSAIRCSSRSSWSESSGSRSALSRSATGTAVFRSCCS